VVVKVGVRELRENLASWLDRVQAGDEVIVTERGKPVACLGPVERRSKLEELIAQGRVTPAKKPKTPIDRSKQARLRGRPTLSDFVIEERRSARY
jgi:prevent-host-death family protein